ncbi:MAG: PorT family protein [Sphingobacteriales bacterium]|nr:MAG: PorT family protein [Sphingobacteriales bacterium]
MSEELDNDLKRRISEVFDNYEDPSADEGWMLLREKFPATAKHRGTAWLWWASAAAVFLLFLGVGAWLITGQPEKTEQIVAQKPAKNTGPKAVSPTAIDTENGPVTAPVQQNDVIVPVTGDNYAARKAPRPAVAPVQQPVVEAKPIVPEVSTASIIASISNVPPAVKTKDTAATVAPKAVKEVYAATQSTVAPVVVEKKPALQQAPEKKTMESLFAQEAMANAGKKTTEKQNKDKNVHFGVFAGTYMNYANGSDNQVNVGAGFSSDFRISKNLKLSTGVSIAQNSFNYAGNNNLPQQAASASLVAQAVQNNDKGFNASGSSPVLNNYNARLTGLDVPVNLKFEFNPDKSDTYISAGLSSGTFINESYTYKYNYPALFSGNKDAPQPQQQVDEKITDSFNGFYFGRTLNVAFGVGYPLGKHNRLVIEPFVKYPLSGLGAQQIKFGSGGINLKLNFQTRKK